MIIPPPNRERLSWILRIAAKSGDAELAALAHAGLRQLKKAPAMPRPRKGSARGKLPRPVEPRRPS